MVAVVPVFVGHDPGSIQVPFNLAPHKPASGVIDGSPDFFQGLRPFDSKGCGPQRGVKTLPAFCAPHTPVEFCNEFVELGACVVSEGKAHDGTPTPRFFRSL
jgi:hypothetical protein